MDTELLAVRDFLATHHPFDQLPAEILSKLPEQIAQRSFAKNEIVLEYGSPNDWLYIIRQGAVEVHDPNEGLLARLSEGDIFGHRSLLGDGIADDSFRAIEDTLLVCLPAELFHDLRRDHAQFRYFFGPIGAKRLHGALQAVGNDDDAGVNLMTTPIAEIVSRPAVTLPINATVREAAELMTREGISSLMVVDATGLQGIVTDRDLRSRVIAAGLSYEKPLGEIMTASPGTIDARNYAYEALTAMARGGIHHLPVVRDGRLIGMITSTDLVHRRSTNPLYVLGDVYKQPDVDSLVQISQRLKAMLAALVNANASAHSIGHLVSSVGEAINCRLLALGEEKLGPPPVSYAWLTGGSLARREQTAHSDQDNCLLIADTYREQQHGEYFKTLADFVCDGLDACGYVYCPGEVMAKTPKWRQPFQVWKSYFDDWIDQPEPKSLMHACIFFDLRCLYGDTSLFKELQGYVMDKAARNRIFHAYMASNALSHQPPLGFFRNFVLVKDGKHDDTLDLKHNGVIPIVDLARVHALASGVAAVNTRDRLEAVAGTGALSRDGAANLRDALEFIATVRLRHQARQIQTDKKPDNFMSPKDLSPFERSHLKDAFAVVRTIQSAFGQRYQVGLFG